MSLEPTLEAEDYRSQLIDLGRKVAKAERDRTNAMSEIRSLIPSAHNIAGLSPTEIARLTGVSRRTVYNILSEE